MKVWRHIHSDILDVGRAVTENTGSVVRVRFGRVYEHLRRCKPELYDALTYGRVRDAFVAVFPLFRNRRRGVRLMTISRAHVEELVRRVPVNYSQSALLTRAEDIALLLSPRWGVDRATCE